jgi:subtilase family serine protease
VIKRHTQRYQKDHKTKSMLNKLIVVIAILAVLVANGSAAFLKKEQMNKRSDFVMKTKASPDMPHEVVFAVKQRNLDRLESMLMERATPGSPLYQKWMTFKEVGELTGNPEAAEATIAWLESHGIKVQSHAFVYPCPQLYR